MVIRGPALGMLSLAFPSKATFAFLKQASWRGLHTCCASCLGSLFPFTTQLPVASQASATGPTTARPAQPAAAPTLPQHLVLLPTTSNAEMSLCIYLHTSCLPPPLKCSQGKEHRCFAGFGLGLEPVPSFPKGALYLLQLQRHHLTTPTVRHSSWYQCTFLF